MTPRKLASPQAGKTYLLRDLVDLDLKDSPFLMVLVNGQRYPVQDSHLTVDELLSVPGLADTEWTYRYTTSEWCPIFYSSGDLEVESFFDVKFLEEEGCYWITPKGFPREVPE